MALPPWQKQHEFEGISIHYDGDINATSRLFSTQRQQCFNFPSIVWGMNTMNSATAKRNNVPLNTASNYITETISSDQNSDPFSLRREALDSKPMLNISHPTVETHPQAASLNLPVPRMTSNYRLKRSAPPWETQKQIQSATTLPVNVDREKMTQQLLLSSSSSSNDSDFPSYSLAQHELIIPSSCSPISPIAPGSQIPRFAKYSTSSTVLSWKGRKDDVTEMCNDPQVGNSFRHPPWSTQAEPIPHASTPLDISHQAPVQSSNPFQQADIPSSTSLRENTFSQTPPDSGAGNSMIVSPKVILDALASVGLPEEELEQIKQELACPEVQQLVVQLLMSDIPTVRPLAHRSSTNDSRPLHESSPLNQRLVVKPLKPQKQQQTTRRSSVNKTPPMGQQNYSKRRRNEEFKRNRYYHSKPSNQDSDKKQNEELWYSPQSESSCPQTLAYVGVTDAAGVSDQQEEEEEEEEEGEILDDTLRKAIDSVSSAKDVEKTVNAMRPRNSSLERPLDKNIAQDTRRNPLQKTSECTQQIQTIPFVLPPPPQVDPFLSTIKNHIKFYSQFLEMPMDSKRISEMSTSLGNPFGIKESKLPSESRKTDPNVTTIANIHPGLAQLQLFRCTVLNRLSLSPIVMQQLSPNAQGYLIADATGSAVLCVENSSGVTWTDKKEDAVTDHRRKRLRVGWTAPTVRLPLWKPGQTELRPGDIIDLFDIDTHFLNEKLVRSVFHIEWINHEIGNLIIFWKDLLREKQSSESI